MRVRPESKSAWISNLARLVLDSATGLGCIPNTSDGEDGETP